ncbi:MAG: sugar ABC transporter permease [Treponema sp.]|nr:sugar ABC transporter permease [Treponema sp.]
MRQKNVVNYAKWGYIFSIPFVVTFLIFLLYPLVYTAFIGFTNLQGMASMMPDFKMKILDQPFDNFISMLNNNAFRVSLSNTFKIWIMNFIPQMVLALLLTAWFTNQRYKFKGMGAFKVLFYMPNIITAASIAILFFVLFSYPAGPVNQMLVRFGILEQPHNFMVDGNASQMIVAFIQFWMWYGYTMLIFISGVLGLNPSMYEASEIDGASSVQQFFYITLPNLRTIMIFVLISSLVGGLNMFDIPRLFNNGMPGYATSTMSFFIYNQAFAGSYLYNRAAAASMMVFLIIAVLSAIIFFVLRDGDSKSESKLEKGARKAIKKAGGMQV